MMNILDGRKKEDKLWGNNENCRTEVVTTPSTTTTSAPVQWIDSPKETTAPSNTSNLSILDEEEEF
jgi:hypothetical protein